MTLILKKLNIIIILDCQMLFMYTTSTIVSRGDMRHIHKIKVTFY